MIQHFASFIAHSALSAQLQDHVWIVPAFQSLHIVAIAFLFFSAVAVGAETARARVPASAPWIASAFNWTWVALAVLLLSGSILIGAEPVRSLMNLFFRIKIVLVIAAAVATILLQRRLARGAPSISLSERATALVPVTLWVGIIFCGRLIAYFGNLVA